MNKTFNLLFYVKKAKVDIPVKMTTPFLFKLTTKNEVKTECLKKG